MSVPGLRHSRSVGLFEVLLDVGNVLAGDGGFVHVGVDFEHLLEVLEGGIEFGDAAGFHGLGHEGESERVVPPPLFRVASQSLLPIAPAPPPPPPLPPPFPPPPPPPSSSLL